MNEEPAYDIVMGKKPKTAPSSDALVFFGASRFQHYRDVESRFMKEQRKTIWIDTSASLSFGRAILFALSTEWKMRLVQTACAHVLKLRIYQFFLIFDRSPTLIRFRI